MIHSSFLVIISFGMIGAHSKIIRILGDDYDSSVVKTYEGTAPSTIDLRFVNGTSSLVANVRGKGYYIGPLDRLGKIYNFPNYIPNTRNNNFTDLFGNTLLCENGELEMKKTKKRYKIRIRPSASIIECYLDNGKNRIFLLCGETKNEKRGKLYVFDTKNIDIQRDYVLTEEIVAVGDNITAVTVGHHGGNTGIIVLIEELSDKNSFNIHVLKQKSRTFDDATEQAAVKITTHFHKVLQSRVNRLANDNSRLRHILEVQLQQFKDKGYSLPEKVTNINSTSSYVELKNVFDKMRKKMKLLYEQNTLRNDTKKYAILGNRTRRNGLIPLPRILPEVVWCSNRTSEHQVFECATESQFENKAKDFVISEKAFVEIEEWLNAGEDMKGILGVINVLGQNYEVNMPKNHFINTQSFIDNQRDIFSLIGTKFEIQPLISHDPKYKTFSRKIPLSFGNLMNCNNDGSATFVDQNTFPKKNYVIKTGRSRFTFQCYGDIKRNRAFLLSGDEPNPSKGKLYAFDTSEVDIDNGEVVSEEIADLGNSITAVTVRDSDGVIMLSQEITVFKKKAYKMVLLKPISEEIAPTKKKSTDLLTVASDYSSKLYSTYDAEESEFINAIVEVEDSSVNILKEKWKIRSKELVDEQEKLQTVGSVLLTYFYKVKDDTSRFNLFQSIVSLLALNDTIVKSTFEDELSTYIKDTGKDLFKKYIKERTVTMSEFQLLDLEVVCKGEFTSAVTEKDEWYSCVRSSEWRVREKFHERLKIYFDEILEFNHV